MKRFFIFLVFALLSLPAGIVAGAGNRLEDFVKIYVSRDGENWKNITEQSELSLTIGDRFFYRVKCNTTGEFTYDMLLTTTDPKEYIIDYRASLDLNVGDTILVGESIHKVNKNWKSLEAAVQGFSNLNHEWDIVLYEPNSPEPYQEKTVEPPNDGIGTYTIDENGKKIYILFNTYETCMYCLGNADLCSQPQHCCLK